MQQHPSAVVAVVMTVVVRVVMVVRVVRERMVVHADALLTRQAQEIRQILPALFHAHGPHERHPALFAEIPPTKRIFNLEKKK